MAGGSYSEAEKDELPRIAADASLGCGDPVTLATLSPGEVVLDLGSGGGIGVLLSARRVAPDGKVYGLDMADEMLGMTGRTSEKPACRTPSFSRGRSKPYRSSKTP